MAKAVDAAPIRADFAVVIHNGLKNGAYAKHRSAAADFRHLRGFLADLYGGARVVEVLYDLHETMQGLYIVNCFCLAIVHQKCKRPDGLV